MDDFNGTDEEVQGEEDSCNPLPLFDHDHGPAGRYGRNRSEPLSYTGPGPSRSSTSSSSRSMGGVYPFEAFHTFSRPVSPSSRSSSVDTLSMCESADVGNDTEVQIGVMDLEFGKMIKGGNSGGKIRRYRFGRPSGRYWGIFRRMRRVSTPWRDRLCSGLQKRS
jgi:hypothetical protein